MNLLLKTFRLLSFVFFSYGFSFATPSLQIDRIFINYKPIKLPINQQNLSIISLNNDIIIEFKPLKGDSVFYEYQLKNYELDWIKTKFPTARYMNLEKGNYEFYIRCYDRNKEIAQFSWKFEVKASISEVWWFYPVVALSGFLLILGGVYLFFLYNFRQKMKVQHLRNKIASDLHDEIGSTLSSIAISSNVVHKKLNQSSPEIQQILKQIKFDSEQTIHSIQDTVWALNPDNDSFEVLVEKIRSFALQILSAKEIKLVFKNQIKEAKSIKLGIENRKNLFLILKEIINNIAKHSEASEAKIVFNKKNDTIFVEISENGKGFDTTQIFEGNGLKNLQKRANESFFDLKIKSEIGKGTTIKLETLTV